MIRIRTMYLFFSLLMVCFESYALQRCSNELPMSTPTSRFSINGNGTVTDRETGLMWAQCRQGLSGVNCEVGSPIGFLWSDALALTQPTSNSSITDGWRLPNIKELVTLFELSCYDPAINLTVFPNALEAIVEGDNAFGKQYWSSTPTRSQTNIAYEAWVVNFSSPSVSKDDALFYFETHHYVRLVRDSIIN